MEMALCTTDCFECGEALEGPYCPACNPLYRAAPEMLEALKEAERFLDYFANGRTSFVGGGTPRSAWEQVRAAIAKAEGRS
jgi:hypothetical protein